MMLSCKEVYRLSSRYLDDDDLSFWTRMQMKMHLAMCRHCGKLMEQLRYGQEVVRAVEEGHAPETTPPADIFTHFEARCAARGLAAAPDTSSEEAPDDAT